MRDEVSRTSGASATHRRPGRSGHRHHRPLPSSQQHFWLGDPGLHGRSSHLVSPSPGTPPTRDRQPPCRAPSSAGPGEQPAPSLLGPGAAGKEQELTAQRPGPLDPSRNRGDGGSPRWPTPRQAKNCQGESDSGKGDVDRNVGGQTFTRHQQRTAGKPRGHRPATGAGKQRRG